MDIQFIEVKLGEVIIESELSSVVKENFSKELTAVGFELIDDKKSSLINRIKTEIIQYIHHNQESFEHINFSVYLSDKLAYDYSYISKLFSSVEGLTIEKYIILQKIERVKELLVYDNLNLSEIAVEMDYSSVQHLSRQFKDITGFTPTQFRKQSVHDRKSLDKV